LAIVMKAFPPPDSRIGATLGHPGGLARRLGPAPDSDWNTGSRRRLRQFLKLIAYPYIRIAQHK
jgi:hypothetical protein